MLLELSSFLLHLADQFIACGKSRDVAHELASRIWIAVVDSLEENHHTFCLLKRLALEGDVSFCYDLSVFVVHNKLACSLINYFN